MNKKLPPVSPFIRLTDEELMALYREVVEMGLAGRLEDIQRANRLFRALYELQVYRGLRQVESDDHETRD